MAGNRRTSRLSPSWRKFLLVVHIGTSVGLLGADAAVLLLDVAGVRGSDPGAVYPAAELVATTLLIPLALASLLSGLALALLTPWGLFRHWWVALKFVLTSAGVVLALAVLTPALDGAADAAQAGTALSVADRWVLVRNSGAASVVLVVTLALSVYKPFGRVRRLRLGAGPRSAGVPRVG